MIQDHYGRPLNSLRVQVNATCNFKCFFCHMEGTETNLSTMNLEEIEKTMMAAAHLGISRIKFTGGEPLLRKDFPDIVRVTKKHIHGDISATTNGYFLNELAGVLKQSGLKRINVSLHGLTPESFRMITSVDAYSRVIRGIKEAVNAGLNPVKINLVVLKGINQDQIFSLLDFATEIGAMVQFIELEASKEEENSEWFKEHHVKLDFIERMLKPYAYGSEFNSLHRRKIMLLEYKGTDLKVELVEPHRNHDFCMNCTRLRLTSSGYLQTCLHRPDQRVKIDYLDPVNSFIEATEMREPYW